MFATIIGGAFAHPGSVHNKFKVGLGLDLSSGTTVTIKTVVLTPGSPAPTSSQMSQSIAILTSRVNGQGFTGAKIQQQGKNDIVVSVPHKSAQDIAPLLRSDVLRFRQVLAAPGRPAGAPPAPPRTSALPGSRPRRAAPRRARRPPRSRPVRMPVRVRRFWPGGRGPRARANRQVGREGVGQRVAVPVDLGQPERLAKRVAVAEPEPESIAHEAAANGRRRPGRYHEGDQPGGDQ
jgi:hypothetical protein